MYFMVTDNLQIVDIVIIKSSLNTDKQLQLSVATNSCKYYLETRWLKTKRSLFD